MLDLFVRDASLAEFKPRLQLMKMFKKELKARQVPDKLKPRHSKVLNVLSYVTGYYGQFEHKLDLVINRLDLDAREKVRTLIDISKWNIQKFDQLKSNVDKTHRQLS